MSPRTKTVLRWGSLALVLFPGGLVAWWLVRRITRGPSTFAYPSFITKRRVTNARADAEGWVQTPPRELARQAGQTLGMPGPLDIEVYSLARAIGSETGGEASALEKAAIGWTVVNRASRRGWTLLHLATNTGDYGDRGLYGSQEHGRVMSTARDPTDADVYVATMILSGEWTDMTGGSTMFLGPAAQRSLHRQCPADDTGRCLQPPSTCRSPSGRVFQSCYRSYEAVLAKWRSEGMEPVAVAGIDPERQTFLRPTG